MDSATIAAQLASYDQNRVTSTDALNQALSQYGVPEIRNAVSGLRTTLANTQNAYNAVDPSVTGRTQGSLVTEAQRTKQVSNERAPIAGQISDQSKALGQNEQDLQTALGQATTTANNRVNDYNTGRAALQSEYDTAYKREQDQAAAAVAARQLAEQQRQFNEQQATARGAARYSGGGSTTNPAQGYVVKQLSSGNKVYAGPNGQTNLYQYASAVGGGDPGQTYNVIKQQLASGSATDKGAYNGILKLEKQGLSQQQIIQRLQKSNGYIFN